MAKSLLSRATSRFISLLLLATSFQIVSCGSSVKVLPMGSTTAATYETSDYVGIPALALGAGRFVTGTVSHDSARFFCFNEGSTMSPVWSSSIAMGPDQLWFPRLSTQDGHVVAVGPLTSITNMWGYGDVFGLKAVTLDPKSGAISEIARPVENQIPEESMQRGAYNIAYSPDSSKMLFFQYRLSDALDKDTDRTVVLAGTVYSRTLKPLGFGTLTLPIDPDVTNKSLKRDIYAEDVYLDNDGNFYQLGTAKPNSVLVFRHDLKTHQNAVLDTTIPGIDLSENSYGFRHIKAGFDRAGSITLGFTRQVSKRESDAIFVVKFDFNAMKIDRVLSTSIAAEHLSEWFDDNMFWHFRVSGIHYTSSPRMMLVVVERQKGGEIDVPHIKGWNHGDAIILGFDTTGKLAFQSAIAKRGAFVDAAQDLGFMTHEVPGRMEMYFPAEDNVLTRVDLSLPKGTLSAPQALAKLDVGVEQHLSGFDGKTGYLVCKDGNMMPTITYVRLNY